MNRGTKIRTALLAVAIINQAISQVGEPDFGNETANTVYRIVSYIFMVAAAAIAFWYNNDLTDEACAGTGLTRQLKAEKKAGYVGDYFFDEGEEDEAEAEDEDEEEEEEEDDEQEDLEAAEQQVVK